MRFKIHVQHKSRKAFLPIDYQYAMASAVYKLIAKGDHAYSRFLHDEGFSPGGLKRFKLFTFSPLVLPQYTIWKEKELFELHGNTLSFIVSFMADKAAEAFVKGMFTDQRLDIGDHFYTLQTEVTRVEAMTPPFFKEVMHYRCVSPLTIEQKGVEDKYGHYLFPDNPHFGELLIGNLIAKCAAFNILHHDKGDDSKQLRFELKSNYRSKLITIKPYTEQQTKVRGFLFDFSLAAPEYMQEIGYYAGFGMNNGMGFGTTIIRI